MKSEGDIEKGIWRFEFYNLSSKGCIPAGLKLRLLTEYLQLFEYNQRIDFGGEEKLEIIVALSPEEGIVWEIESRRENYDREILRF